MILKRYGRTIKKGWSYQGKLKVGESVGERKTLVEDRLMHHCIRSTRVCLSHNVLLHFGGGMEEVHRVT